jgi:hypothetical protein
VNEHVCFLGILHTAELEDDYTYTVVLATYKDILTLMNKEKSHFAEPYSVIIGRKLTKEINSVSTD